MKNIKPAVLSVALAALLSPLSALAIGLGAASVKSSLYEPLRADVALSVNAGEDITGASFVIASPAKFAQAGLPYPAWVADLSASVERSGKTARLRLRSTKPIYEPMARILIEARLPNGSALLPVTLMLDTPFSKPLGSELAPMLPGAAQERKPQPEKAKGKHRAQAQPGAPAPARAKAQPNAHAAPAASSGSEAATPKAAPSLSTAPVAAPALEKPKAPAASGPLDATASAASTAPAAHPNDISAPPANSDSAAALASSGAPSESVALPSSEEPAASPTTAAPASTPLAAPASAPAQPAFGSPVEPPAPDSGLFGLPSWWPWIGGSIALLAAAAASWARARRKRSDGSEELSVTTSSEAYSATEEALGQRSAPYFEEPAAEPEPPQASSFGPSDATDLSSLDSFLSQAADLPQGPSLAKSEPDFPSPDFASSLDDELSKAVSGGSSSAHELHQIDSLREEVFSNEFRIDSSFDIRPATPLAPMAKTREDFTFESLNEQVKAPSQDTLRPILSDPESFRAPEPDSNLMAFEPFQAPVLAPASETAADHPNEPFSFSLEPAEDAFSQAEALSQSAQGRSAPLALGEAFKVDDSVGERPGRLQLELACLYAQSEDWDGARASLNEVLADSDSSEAHPEARRLMALIP